MPKNVPESGPFHCLGAYSLLELVMPHRQEIIDARRQTSHSLLSQHNRVRLQQEMEKSDLELVLHTALDESHLRAIARASVSGPEHTAKASSDLESSRLNGGGERGELSLVGLPVGLPIETPHIRRGRDVVFHSAVAGEEVRLNEGWTKQGIRKLAFLQRVHRRVQEEEEQDEDQLQKKERDAEQKQRLGQLQEHAAASVPTPKERA